MGTRVVGKVRKVAVKVASLQQGMPDRVDDVLAWMAEGPPGSDVADARVQDAEPTAADADFEVRATA